MLGLGQYTLNKHVTFFTFLHIIESSVRQRSSCRFSAQHTCGRTVWEMCKEKKKTRCVSSRATLLVKSVGNENPSREYLKCNMSVSVPMQWKVFYFGGRRWGGGLSQAFLPLTLECSDSSATRSACWEIEFLPLIPSGDLKVNECELISAEIIFVLIDKARGGGGLTLHRTCT